MKPARDESGQVLVLVLGLSLIAFAVAGVAIDGTRALIYRRTLQNAADAAAMAGADAIDRDTYYSSGGERIELDIGKARAAAVETMSRRGVAAPTRIEGNRGGIAVTIRSSVETSFLRLIGVDRLDVAATARAAPVPAP